MVDCSPGTENPPPPAGNSSGRARRSPPFLHKNTLQLIDSVEMLDNAKKWQELYQSVVIRAAR
jgi:hypothetical protein